MKFGDVYLCRFPFTSGAASKLRPALVLFDVGSDAVICRITSASHGGYLDITLTDWASAGLLKPSVARLDRLVTAEKSVLSVQLGALSARDLQLVRATWNAHMTL